MIAFLVLLRPSMVANGGGGAHGVKPAASAQPISEAAAEGFDFQKQIAPRLRGDRR
jgi:hypothetical protein